MGFGGGSRNNAAMQQQLQLMQLQMIAQARGQEEARNRTLMEANARATALRTQEAGAQKALQKKSRLSLFDAVKTSAAGLLNEPSTGKLTLLGN